MPWSTQLKAADPDWYDEDDAGHWAHPRLGDELCVASAITIPRAPVIPSQKVGLGWVPGGSSHTF